MVARVEILRIDREHMEAVLVDLDDDDLDRGSN